MALSFPVLLLARLLLALGTVTRYHADEYWQSQEPAYNIFYPEAGGYWSYEWVFGIRGYFSLFPFLVVMALTKLIGSFSSATEDWMLFNARKIAAAFIAAVSDYFMLKCATKYFGAARSAYIWFMLFNWCDCEISESINRAYSNGTEVAFSMMAMYYWPLKWSQKQHLKALSLAGLAVLTRTSSIVTWIVPSVLSFSTTPNKFTFVGQSFLLALIIFGLGLVIDRVGHGSWVATAWNFIYWNLFKGLSAFHGRSPVSTYLIRICKYSIRYLAPVFAYGIFQALKSNTRANLMLIATTVLIISVFSYLEHKEVRFVLFPHIILTMYSAFGAQQFDVLLSKKRMVRLSYRVLLAVVLFSNALATMYSMRFRQYGFEQAIHLAIKFYDSDKSLWKPSTEKGVISVMSYCFLFPGKGLINRPVDLDVTVCPGGKNFLSKMNLSSDDIERLTLACEGSPESLIRNYQFKNKTMPSIVVVRAEDVQKNFSGWTDVVHEAGYSLCEVIDIRGHPFLELVRSSPYLRKHTRYQDSHLAKIYLYCRRRDGRISNNFYTLVSYNPSE